MVVVFCMDNAWDNDPRRNLVASQLMTARHYDRHNGYEVNRYFPEYVEDIRGIKHLLEYVRNNLPRLGSNKILDVGIGRGRATREMSVVPWGEGLVFEGTTVSITEDVVANFGKTGLHITSAESLSGVADNSMAAVLSCFGVAYSKAPDKAIAQVDRVLVPSGVFKAVFYDVRLGVSEVMHPDMPDEFVLALRNSSFDVAVRLSLDEIAIVVAVKPPVSVAAVSLLTLDANGWRAQAEEAKRLLT